jgi:hypothetical protein
VLREEVGEISHLLLQGDQVGLHGAKLLWQFEQVGRQGGDLAGKLGRDWLRTASQMAMMQVSQHLQVLLAHPFFAAIAGMVLQGKLRIR